MWEISEPLPDELQEAIISHLKDNCALTFDGPHRLSGESAPHYGGAFLCQLVLAPGCSLRRGGRKKQLQTPAVFYFLFRVVNDEEVLIPLTGGEGDILLAKRWLGLSLQTDEQRLSYARFYCAYAQTDKPPQFRNVPRRLSDLQFERPVTEQQIWGIYGALWRFLVVGKTMDVRVHFEPRGPFWFARHRAHVPMQIGTDLIDVDLKIWDRDGHVSCRKTGLIYRDEALAELPQELPSKIGRPRYVRRSEWLRTLYGNFKSRLYQAAYLAASTLFLLASAIGVAFPLEALGYPVVRMPLELLANTTNMGDWITWLWAACLYCLAYFVLTTLLILDVETLRNALLTWSPRFRKSWLNEFLHGIVVRRYRVEHGYRRGLVRRIQGAASWLVIWTGYLVCVFTSLQTSFRPWLATDQKALTDVMQLFAEQALLYIPVVFYYVGRKSLDPAKIALVSFWVLLAFQLIMGLLVIRRVHRFWASTAAARLNEHIVRSPAPASTLAA